MVGLNMCDWTSCSSETFTAKYGQTSHRRWHGAVIHRSALDYPRLQVALATGLPSRWQRLKPRRDFKPRLHKKEMSSCQHRTSVDSEQPIKSQPPSRSFSKVIPETMKIFKYSVFELPIRDWYIWGGFEFRIRFCKIFFPGFEFSKKTRFVFCWCTAGGDFCKKTPFVFFTMSLPGAKVLWKIVFCYL